MGLSSWAMRQFIVALALRRRFFAASGRGPPSQCRNPQGFTLARRSGQHTTLQGGPGNDTHHHHVGGYVLRRDPRSRPREGARGADGDTYMIESGRSVTLSGFRGRAYRDLSSLLPAVPPGVLTTAHVLAFEHNGGHPAPSGGWESCYWRFTDGATTYEVDWDERVGVARDPSIVANGSIRGSDYSSYFGFPPSNLGTTDPNHIVISYLLYALPDSIDPTSHAFSVRISGVESIPNEKEATPDVDAVGVLGCHVE